MRILSRYLLLMTAGTLLIPAYASAKDGQPAATRAPEVHSTASPSASPKAGEGSGHLGAGEHVQPAQLCTRIGDIGGTVNDGTAQSFAQLSDNFTKRGDKIKSDFDALTSKIGDSRHTSDIKLGDYFTKLEGQATTADQKAAVAAFKASIKQALATRRTATDAADAAFKAALLADVSGRQAQLKTAAATYKSAVAAAIAQAKASCSAGTDPATVRSTLKTALQTAKANLDAARKAANKIGNVDTLQATRKAAIDKANADFKAAVQTALTTLRTALGITTSPSPSVSPVSTP